MLLSLRFIQKTRYIQSKSDYSLFTKTIGSSFIVVFLFVEDILLTGNDDVKIKHLKVFFLQHFRIKDLGTLKYFIGIEFSRSKHGLFISQRKYMLDILDETDLTKEKLEKFPMEQNLKLTPTDDDLMIYYMTELNIVG